MNESKLDLVSNITQSEKAPGQLTRTLRNLFKNLFLGFDEASLPAEARQTLHTWREKVTQILIFVKIILNTPLLAAAAQGRINILPQPAGLLMFLANIPLFITFFIKAVPLRQRVITLLLTSAATGAIQLGTMQLVGSGRSSLLILPITAMILAGSRTAWATMALSTAIFAAIPILIYNQFLPDLGITGININQGYWAFQAFVWLGQIIPEIVILAHFLALQQKTLTAECTARKLLATESSERRRLEAEISRISEAERQKLGSELHDGLCQHLTATLLNCTALEFQQKAAGTADTTSIERIRGAVEKSISMAYEVARGLCPVHMEPDSLIPALQQICQDVREQKNIACKLQAQQEITIQNPEHALHLYRIAGEAVKNAVKHSRCSNITIKLTLTKTDTILEVIDNGIGISHDSNNSPGMGLQIISYRASLIGATLEILSNETGGTTIACHLPIPESDK